MASPSSAGGGVSSGSTLTGGSSSTAGSTASGGGGTTGTTTGPWMGPPCRGDINCNGGQTGTDNVCGTDGHCVIGCHSRSDCSAGDSCDIPDGGSDGNCTNGETFEITIPATDGTFDLPGPIQITGQGTDEIGAIQITDNLGSVDFEGDSVAAVAYEIQPFGSETLYQLLGVESDALVIVWAYCQSGELVDLYRETSDGIAVTYEQASGTCGDSGADAGARLALPGFTLEPPPGLTPGVSMTGATMIYDGGSPGRLVTGGTAWTVFPFNTVDCATCGNPGWYEVHSVLWNAADSQAGFGIFYLIDGRPGTIQLSYSLILPTLTRLDETFGASWSHP